MREDIEMNTDNGDIQIRKTPPTYIASMNWVNEDDDFVYGKCILSDNMSLDNLIGGVGFSVKQKDSLKKIKIMFAVVNGRDEETNTGYLPVFDIDEFELIGTNLVIISDEMIFRAYISSDKTKLTLANGDITDLNTEESHEQNEELLLVANPSSMYSSPLSGVGIRSYLNGNIIDSDLPIKVKEEFDLDQIDLLDMQYNIETKEIVTYSKER